MAMVGGLVLSGSGCMTTGLAWRMGAAGMAPL